MKALKGRVVDLESTFGEGRREMLVRWDRGQARQDLWESEQSLHALLAGHLLHVRAADLL